MAVTCVKNHYERTYFDEFMPTCLRGAVFLDTVYSINNNMPITDQYIVYYTNYIPVHNIFTCLLSFNSFTKRLMPWLGNKKSPRIFSDEVLSVMWLSVLSKVQMIRVCCGSYHCQPSNGQSRSLHHHHLF